MYKKTLVGNLYVVRAKIYCEQRTGWTSGDHYTGGEYTYYKAVGEACIYDVVTSRPFFAFRFTADSGRLSSMLSDDQLKRYIEAEGILLDRRAAYADWLANKWIEQLGRLDSSGDMPEVVIVEPNLTELARDGFIVDRNGQQSLPLHDVQEVNTGVAAGSRR